MPLQGGELVIVDILVTHGLERREFDERPHAGSIRLKRIYVIRKPCVRSGR
jgi:hypothetical protein